LNHLKINQTKAFVYKKKIIFCVIFDLGLALILQQVNLIRARDQIKNQHLIDPLDTGQRIVSFNKCQLTTTRMSNIKEGRYKPRLHVSVNQ